MFLSYEYKQFPFVSLECNALFWLKFIEKILQGASSLFVTLPSKYSWKVQNSDLEWHETLLSTSMYINVTQDYSYNHHSNKHSAISNAPRN